MEVDRSGESKGAARINPNAPDTSGYARASNYTMPPAAYTSDLARQAQNVRLVVDAIPTLAWSARSDGSADFFNQRWLEYTGLSTEQARDWGWTVALHPDDVNGLVDYWRSVLDSGEPGEMEARLRRFDGVHRWFLFRATPSFDSDGRVVKWFGTNTDIEDRKRAECLLAGENLVLEMTARGGSLESILEALCRVVEQTASGCLCSVLLIDASGSKIQQAVAPSLPSSYNDQFPGIPVDQERGPCAEAARRKTQVIVSDVASDTRWDTYGWRNSALTHGLKACWSTVILASNGLVLGTFAIYWREPRRPSEQDQKIIGQITHLAAVAIERKRNEAALQGSEERFRLIVDTIPGFVFTLSAGGKVELLNRQALEYFGTTIEEWKDSPNFSHVHPDDLPRVMDAYRDWLETGQPHDLELRQRRADGVYRWFQSRALPARDSEGRITGWYILLTDIDDRKRAEDALRSNEQSLRQIIDSIPGFVSTLSAAGEVELVNRQILEYFGNTTEEWKNSPNFNAVHPDDLPRMIDSWRHAIKTGQPPDLEIRSRRADGLYRWFHVRGRPQRDGEGRIVRWYTLATDIDERKRAESELEKAFEEIKRLKDRLHDENAVLREQIDQVFMFEEIVGSSPALKTVLSGIVKVAPTNSTVLITGETGTGKELIARAIHKGSQRADHAFIGLNCAAIPPALIASELFGHEKGAFTGALQQRQGRFELAHSGTIFLDEIGELPAETQIALLRVLQERQFERVGGNRIISTDVRIVAATNRDLVAAIASGTFRADLFYRLNVFPIHVPPLRDRREDIPMLVEYFVKRYAETARKQITKIDKHTLKLCHSYDWPGNIRELQNIIERSVILCTGDTFWIDEAWLSSQNASWRKSSGALTQNLQSYEKELVEAALAESNGKVAGPNGAAAKLGIPPSTLHLKIKQLKIEKHTLR
ncbi:MAG TPA: sigma 54-interacting transcriptional regulator [Candidatus Acidoferrum sp.]|nr:sigma 54-interacting transcriptional regulator [Candidatus Acidoferrum sp.]